SLPTATDTKSAAASHLAQYLSALHRRLTMSEPKQPSDNFVHRPNHLSTANRTARPVVLSVFEASHRKGGDPVIAASPPEKWTFTSLVGAPSHVTVASCV